MPNKTGIAGRFAGIPFIIADEMPDDEELLELDDAEDALAELEDLNALANVMSDDPVKQYLKEIEEETK